MAVSVSRGRVKFVEPEGLFPAPSVATPTRSQRTKKAVALPPLPSVEQVIAARRACDTAARSFHATVGAENAESAPIDVIDLFCGCGGLSAGFRLFSNFLPAFRLAGALDLDPDATATYKLNLGVTPFLGDAHALAGGKGAWRRFSDSLDRRSGNYTVVVGGPPCQGFTSHKRSIDGLDQMNNLFPDFARLAVRLHPDAIIIENVPELLTNRSWPFYEETVAILRKAGYLVRTQVHSVADYGVPQERFRALTIAMRRPFAMPVPQVPRGQYATVREAIGFLPPVVPGVPSEADPDHWVTGHRPSTIQTIAAVPKNGGRRPLHIGPECLRKLAQRNGRTGYDDVYGRLWWDRPSVTITGSSRNPASGRFSHPEQDRGLSVREAAQLQGFPLNYRFTGRFENRFLQIGNAVPPMFAAHIAGHLLHELVAPRKECPASDADVRAPLGTSFSRLIPGIKQGAIRL